MTRFLVFIFIMILGLSGCSTTKTSNDQDIAESPSPVTEPNSADDPPADETSEQDFAQNGQQGAQNAASQTQDQAANQNQSQNQSSEADQAGAQSIPPPPVEENMAEASGPAARVTALDFNGALNGGTVVIKTNKPVIYSTRKNQSTNQFVIELQNTVVPKQFRRPYNTKEFSSPIASINAYQAKGQGRLARIVVQLRQAIEPGVEQNGRVISVAGSGVGSGPDPKITMAQAPEVQDSNPAPEANVAEANVAEAEGETETDTSQMPSGQKAMNDYLSGNSKFYGKPISIEVKDADIRDVLRLISEESGINLLVQDDVSGKISLKLRKIPWDQALTVILQAKQLGYVKQGNILRIAPLKAIESETEAAKKVIDAQRDLLPLRVKLFPVSYAVATDLELQVKDFLSSRGKARADKRTNMLVVTDIDEVIAKIQTLVSRLDTQTPQVLIEAKVVEAREGFTRVIGVNWNFNGSTTNIGGVNSQGVQQTFKANGSSTPGGNNSGGLSAGFTLGSLDVFGDLTASLSLLEAENLVKIISSPRIVTLDRQEAKIEQTTSFPLFNSSVTPTGGVQGQTTFQDVKLALDVKPQISADGGIIMDVDITREFPDAAVSNASGTSSARPINKRHASTKVLVENGDTVVIGGIYQSDVTEAENGIPFLRKIPLLGALFRSRSVDREKNELVIFITPRILNREKAFNKGNAG